MGYRKIFVEPAKSSLSACKNCKKKIQKGELRIQVKDDRQFKDCIARNGGFSAFACEGLSRGYLEVEDKCISIQKYFVHVKCYKPLQPHPFEMAFFTLKKVKQTQKEEFIEWLSQQRHCVSKQAPKSNNSKKSSKKKMRKNQDQQSFQAKKSKTIKKTKN